MARIATFDDWTDLFKEWRNDIGVDPALMEGYEFQTKFGEAHSKEIEFGDYSGQPKWETLIQIPEQRVRDALLHLIVYQGDTEFASVEQQRRLVDTAPGHYDLQGLVRIMREEMRHGWQMSHLLVNYFGEDGKREAQKLLERRAFEGNRLLGSFNQDVSSWVDFYTYTEFIDRDGKYQLTMLSHSSFAPLARSMPPMLQEEAFHLLTGNSGLMRILKAGKVPVEILQKHFNKWIPTAYDLFGTDSSSSAEWAYVWGLKGRVDEDDAQEPADRRRLNELARRHYLSDITAIIAALNQLIPEGKPKLIVPDSRFNRSIGEFAGKPYSVTGELLSPEEFQQHLGQVLPGPEDRKILQEIFKEKDWIVGV